MFTHSLSPKADTADLLKTTNLPGSPPGANNSVFKFLDVVTSTPDKLRNAFSESLSSDKTRRIDLGVRYFLPRLLPFPALIPLPSRDRFTSSNKPRLSRSVLALLLTNRPRCLWLMFQFYLPQRKGE